MDKNSKRIEDLRKPPNLCLEKNIQIEAIIQI